MNEEEELLQSQGFENIYEKMEWERQLKVAKDEEERAKAAFAAQEAEKAMTADSSSPAQQTEAPQQEQPVNQRGLTEPIYSNVQAVETSPFKKEDGTIDYDKIDAYGREGDMDVVTGLQDFITGTLNLIPGVDIKEPNKFENEVAQSVREISSVVLPTMALGGGGVAAIGKGVTALKGVKGAKLLADPAVRSIGTTAFQAGSGAFVDNTLSMNERDDNLSGYLKKTYPRTWGWIPDDLATLDGDSPDIKRGKNVFEGAALGVVMDLTMGLTKLRKQVSETHKSLGVVGENEKGKSWVRANQGDVDLSAQATVEFQATKRSEALDELGSYNFDKSTDPTEPIYGYHDAYAPQELGIRSVDDFGIVGASIDAARIFYDAGTVNGRVGSAVSDGALKFMNESNRNFRVVIKGLAETLKDAGEYGYRVDDKRYLSFGQIDDIGKKYANDFHEMDLDELKRAFEFSPYSVYKRGIDADSGVGVLTSAAYNGTVRAIKMYMDDFINMDEAKALAYVGTSFAGQISDMAQGMRLSDGSGSIQRAQEMILDRVEFLMAQKGMTSYVRGRSLNLLNMWKRFTRGGKQAFDDAYRVEIDNAIKNEGNSTLTALDRIRDEAAETVNNLREIKDSDPEMLTPLMMAYELTDGNVKSMTSLNNYVKQSTSVWSKAFYDGQPEIPSVINRAFYANVYNNTLSAFASPFRAVASGTHLLVEKPIRHLAGSLMVGDTQTFRRGLYQYTNMWQSLNGSLAYANQILKRTSLDPNVTSTLREGVTLKNQGQLDILTAFADAKAAKGEYGPQMLMENINAMNALVDHPMLRFGTRSMQAMDGFMESMIANFESKGKAWDMVTQGGSKEFNRVDADKVAGFAYQEMFDQNGIITDKAVKNASGELSFNLDNEFNTGVSNLIQKMPILKPFFLFTKTPLNELKYVASYNPTSPIAKAALSPLLGDFVSDMNVFSRSADDMPTEKMKEILMLRGIDVSDPITAKGKYMELRADILGRKGLGFLMTGSAIGLFMDDRLHGAGHYNRQIQKNRDNNQWKRNSIKGFDGKWHSFEGLGPITTYLSLVATIGDNFDVLEPDDMGTLFKKTAFVFSASFKDRTTLASIEPFMDVFFRGDGGAINRWSSSFLTSATVPGSSQMAEIARLMEPELKIINNELAGMVMNRLPFAKEILPPNYDWIDGGEVNSPDSIWARIRNTYTPWKESGEISPEKQFLIDIEYDATTVLGTYKGEKLSSREQSDLLNTMGKDGLWKQRIQKIMQTTDGKGFRERFKKALNSEQELKPDTKTFESLHLELDAELRDAMGDALTSSKHFTKIDRRRYINRRVQGYLSRKGGQEKAVQYLDYTKQKFGI